MSHPVPDEEASVDPTVSPVGDDATSAPVVTPTVTPKPAGRRGRRGASEDGSGQAPVKLARINKGPDRAFAGASVASGFFITALVAFIGIYLLAMALPSLLKNKANFLLSNEWSVSGNELAFGIAGMLWTTVLSSLIAMLIAVPIAIGIALFLTQYVGPKVAGPVGFMVDLLAAVPSIVYGLWGLKMLAPALQPFQAAISDSPLGRLGFFHQSATGTVFVASVVLAIMILPIVTAISRDVFAQTPRDHQEAALALGATKWEVIRTAVLPYGRSGVISAAMLGLGRALGETVAVMIILSAPAPGSKMDFSMFAGGETFASKIASSASEFDTPSKTGAFIAAGLVLFIVTFAVNAVARIIAERGGAK